MLSFLIDTDVFRYDYIQLIHMYKQLHTTENIIYAGGGYTIMFYTIEFYMFVCGLYLLHTIVYTYKYMLMCTYVIPMTKTHN